MNDQEMESLLSNIAQMSSVVYNKEPHWECKTMDLPAPAVTRQITTLSKQIKSPLPASYLQFLRLHNGCTNFWPTWTFLGTTQIKTHVFATRGSDEYLAFNAKKKSKGIEPEVIHYRDERVEDGYPNFAAFLGTTAYLLQTRILDKGYSAAKQRQVKKTKVKEE